MTFLNWCITALVLGSPPTDTLEIIDTYRLPQSTYYQADPFYHFYLLRNQEIVKIDSTGKQLYSYSNPILGEIYSLDLLYPLKPLVFFEEVNAVSILDNRLNESQSINLLQEGFIDPVLVSYSDQNNIWIYDQQLDQLLRLRLGDRKITAKSLNLTQIIESENRPVKLMANFNRLILMVPELGAMVFDVVGSYKYTIADSRARYSFYNSDELFLLKKNGQLTRYNFKTRERSIHQISTKGEITNIQVTENQLLIYKKGLCTVYALD